MLKSLQKTTDRLQSTLFRHTWKTRTTRTNDIPSCRATGVRIGNGCTSLESWSTPSAHGSAGEVSEDLEVCGKKFKNTKTGRVLQSNLATEAKMLASWPSPVSEPSNGSPESYLVRKGRKQDGAITDIGAAAQLASWPTPQEYDSTNANTPEVWKARQKRNPKMSRSSSPTDLCVTAQLASWPTPRSAEAGPDYAIQDREQSGGFSLQTVASWATPSSRDFKDTSNPKAWNCKEERERMDQLGRQVFLSSWGTPTVQDSKHGTLSPSEMMRDPNNLRLQVHATDFGKKSAGSPAATEKRGQLNPEFSRWLMGLPPAWDDCAVMVTRSVRRSRKSS